jgi:hypothetical protein
MREKIKGYFIEIGHLSVNSYGSGEGPGFCEHADEPSGLRFHKSGEFLD